MPFWEGIVRGRKTVPRWQSFERTQWRSHDEIRQIQLSYLRQLLKHAKEHIPYYRRSFAKAGLVPEDVRTLADLQVLPRLTKAMVREHYADLVDRRTQARHVHKQTSGSSGTPFRFEYDVESEVWRQATRWRGYGMTGYRPGARAAYYWGSPLVLTGLRGCKIQLDRACRREKFIDCYRQDPRTLDETADLIRQYRPRFMVGFTMATAILARHILERGLLLPKPIIVLCAAEAVSARDRFDIEAAFGGPAFETYGTRETMLLACECDRHEGLHTMDEAHVVEVVAGEGPAAPGQVGDILITDLHNYGMPLIRFENGDLGVACEPSPCTCGRGLGRIQRVIGRQSETLRTARGTPVPGMLVHSLITHLDHGLREIQIVQRLSGEVILRAVQGRQDGRAALDTMARIVGTYLRGAPVSVELVDAIEKGPGGKQKCIIVEKSPSGDHDAGEKEDRAPALRSAFPTPV